MAESAVKLWIRDIVQGTYEAAESGYGGSITTPSGVKSSRVRILGTIVEKFVAENRSFASATIDDSTETICVDAHNVSGTNGCHPYRSRHLETDIVTNDTEHYAPL